MVYNILKVLNFLFFFFLAHRLQSEIMRTASVKAQHATPIMLRPGWPCLVSEYTCTKLLSLRVFLLAFLLMGAVLPQHFTQMLVPSFLSSRSQLKRSFRRKPFADSQVFSPLCYPQSPSYYVVACF